VISAVDALPGLYLSTGYAATVLALDQRGRLAADLIAAIPPSSIPILSLQPPRRRHRPRRAGDDVGHVPRRFPKVGRRLAVGGVKPTAQGRRKTM